MLNQEPPGRSAPRFGQGVVAAPHYLASSAGARILADGGNAVDAVIACNAVLNVVYPHMCSLGGDAFWLIYDAAGRELHALNGSGRAPAAALPGWYLDRGHDRIPLRGMLSVTVPGAVDSWATALQRFGSRDLDHLLAPAVQYARSGFPVSGKLSAAIHQHEDLLRQNPAAAAAFMPSGRAPRPGALLVQPDLASSLADIGRGGRAAFYQGRIAEAIAATAATLGGLLTAADLAAHTSDWVTPISTTYRGTEVFELPPPSQGAAVLEALNLLDTFDLAGQDQPSTLRAHLMVEAIKLAYADRDQFIADPALADVPTGRLISRDYALQRRAEISLSRAAPVPAEVKLLGDTVYMCAVDRWGNAVSLIQSICMAFGSGVMVAGAGILLQNRGAGFTLAEDHPNRIAPGKRPFHTLAPAMAFRDGRPWLVFGTMGGEGQPQTQLQVLSNVVDLGLDVQQAIDAPRWLYGRFLLAEEPGLLRLESCFPEQLSRELSALGHRVRPAGPLDEMMGHAQAIMIDPETGVLSGAADPRGDGAAIGF